MTTIPSAIATEAPIRAVRVLSRSAFADESTRGKVKWLMSLGDLKARRDAEQKSLLTIAQAVARAVQQTQATVQQRTDELAALVVELGLAVAREIVGSALDRGDVDPTPTVVHCLRDCVHGSSESDLVVRLHPDDMAIVQARVAAMPELHESVALTKFLADPSLGRGEVRAATEAGKLRYDPREAFERVAAAVRNAAQGGRS